MILPAWNRTLAFAIAVFAFAAACSQPAPTPFDGPPPLTFVEAVRGGEPGTPSPFESPSFVTVSPDGTNVYVTAWGAGTLSVFGRAATTGALTFHQVLTDGVDGTDGLSEPAGVTVSPDGRFVYTVSPFAIALFSREVTSGALKFISISEPGASRARPTGYSAIAVSPDGLHLFVTANRWPFQARESSTLDRYTRDQETGEIDWAGNVVNELHEGRELHGADSMVVSPNGLHVYTAAYLDDAVSVFKQEIPMGYLSFVQSTHDANPLQAIVGGIDSLEGATSVAIAPDGRHVYVAAFVDDAITVFGRDSASGKLSFVESVRDGKDGIDGLGFVNSVVVSPDGAWVFAVGFDDNALVVFARDSATGVLTPAQLLKDGVDGVDGLEGAWFVAMSPDGRHVYVVSQEGAVAVFSVGE